MSVKLVNRPYKNEKTRVTTQLDYCQIGVAQEDCPYQIEVKVPSSMYPDYMNKKRKDCTFDGVLSVFVNNGRPAVRLDCTQTMLSSPLPKK